MALTDQEIEDNAICPVCRGNGKYGRKVIVHGQLEYEYVFCESCGGTGKDQGDGDVD